MSASNTIRGLAAFLSAAFCILATVSWGDTHARPFLPGEKLTYQLKWGPIPAGEAALELLPIEELDNQPVYHIVMTVRTNAFVDLIYTYRSRIDAYVDIDMTRSLRYQEKTRKRRKVKEIIVDFDWMSKQAYFKRVETVIGSKSDILKTEHVTPLMIGTFDPLSVYYYTRLLDLHVGDRITRPISDGLKCTVAEAEVTRRESVTANGVTYDTYLVQPDFKGVNPVFDILAGANILVWVTADARHLPIKLASRITLGHFTGELITVEGVPAIPSSPDSNHR